MDFTYRENMTAEMIVVADTFVEMVEQEWKNCERQRRKAVHASAVALPATAVSGKSVLHGARNVMTRIEQYWRTRQYELEKFLTDSEICKWDDEITAEENL